MCSSRVYTKKGKGARRKKARSVETKQKRRGCVRPFLVIFARVLARELCVGPPVSGQAGLGRPDFSKVAHSSNLSCSHTGLVYRPALNARFLSNAKRKMDDGGKERERERERRNSCLVGLRPFPLINLFSRANQRFHPVVVRILDFFFFNQRFFLNYRQFVVSIGKEDFDINRDEAIDIYF